MTTSRVPAEYKGTTSAPPSLPDEISRCRSDFPSLESAEVYLDSTASSLTPIQVLDAMRDYYVNYRANVHRGTYRSSARASREYEAALERIAGFIGATPEQTVVTMNATHALNLVALSLEFASGDEIIIPTLEHASNMMPWVRVAKTQGARLQWWNPDPGGVLQMSDFLALLSPRTRLVSVAHVSNVLGTVAPVGQIAEICQERGILLCVDACQSAPHLSVDVAALRCDFLVLSAHKMLGPTGAGALYVRDEVAKRFSPAIIGSDAVEASSCPGMAACASGQMPETKWTVAGTPPIAEVIGWAKAVEYLQGLGLDRVREHDERLVSAAAEGLRGIRGVRLYGPKSSQGRTSILSFNIDGVPNEEVGRILTDDFGVSVRAGTHCARGYFMENQTDEEVYGSVRASFYLYNTPDDVHRLIRGVQAIAETCAL